MTRNTWLIAVAFLVSCESPPIPPKPVAAPVAAKTSELTPSETAGCHEYGNAAAGFADDRESGTSLRDEVSAIKWRVRDNPALLNELTELATALYSNPAFKHLSHQGALFAFDLDCQTRILKFKGGGRVYKTQAEIADALADFKTYTYRPLLEIITSYGIKIESVETVPSGALGEIVKPGEVVYEVTFSHGAVKKMPCHLEKWMRGKPLPVAEFVRSPAEFPQINADTDDPLEYWAATGECSTAYSY